MTNINKALVLQKSDSWQMFNRISAKYDLLNHLLSFCFDIGWRKRLIKFLPPRPNLNLLDLATGTADVPITFMKHNCKIVSAVGIDLADKMIQIGRKKVVKAALAHKIVLQHGDAARISFPDKSYDVVTMAFGIRNVEEPEKVLKEMFRVLNTRGRVLILEFSLPRNETIRTIHLWYLQKIVPFIGGLFTGDQRAYLYLNQTIEAFPYGDDFCRLMKNQGFVSVRANPLLFGIATIYQGDKA